jgi:hypothetical protein
MVEDDDGLELIVMYNAPMSTFQPHEKLISLGRFNSLVEANLALACLEDEGITAQLGSDSTANWLNYMGPTITGPELWVREEDADRAREILEEVRQQHQSSADAEDDDDKEEDDENDDAPTTTPPKVRSFRAAVIGVILLPPLLNFYSAWLIAHHRLWQSDDDARFYGAIFFNTIGFMLGWWLWLGKVVEMQQSFISWIAGI